MNKEQGGATLSAIVDLRTKMQKARVAFGNRQSAILRGADEEGETVASDELDVLGDFGKKFAGLEEALDKYMYAQVKDVPIVQEMIKLRGIGPILATKLYLGFDIERAQTVSAMWRFAGLAVIDGKRERPTKGEKLHYSVAMKTVCFLVGDCFIKARSPYRDIYDQAKAKYMAMRGPESGAPKEEQWTLMHCDRAARRKMVKLFLSHLHQVWRGFEGLPVREPYAMEYQGHTTIITPEEMGWFQEAIKKSA